MGDTRITGATNQQIEAGARSIGGRVINREYPDESDIAECEQMLSHFVGPDQRIVEVDDLMRLWERFEPFTKGDDEFRERMKAVIK